MDVKLSQRKILFKIAKLVTRMIIKGEFSYSNIAEISAEELRQRIDSAHPPLLIDTRSAQEFDSGFGHIPEARLIPLMEMLGSFGKTESFKRKVKEMEAQIGELQPFTEHEVITMCPGGGFSLVAAEVLAEAGFKNVKSLSGGVDGWFKKGHPTTRP